MTCREIRSHLEDLQRMEPALSTDSSAITEHAATCPDCGRFLEEQRELATSLRVLRESVPQPPTALDAAVLADYRKYAARKVSSAPSVPVRRRIRLIPALAWTAALAVAAIIAGEELKMFVPTEEGVASTVQPYTAPSQTAPPLPQAAAPRPSATRARHARALVRAKRKLPAPAQHVAESTSPVLAAANPANSFPVGFRSLIYCDALSCGGPMEMIRVQLPLSAAGLASGSPPSGEIVYADVLVGADGIARGIRILK